MKIKISVNAIIRILIEANPLKDISIQPGSDSKNIIWIYVDPQQYICYNLALNEMETFSSETKELFEKAVHEGRSNAADLIIATQNDDGLFFEDTPLPISRMDI